MRYTVYYAIWYILMLYDACCMILRYCAWGIICYVTNDNMVCDRLYDACTHTHTLLSGYAGILQNFARKLKLAIDTLAPTPLCTYPLIPIWIYLDTHEMYAFASVPLYRLYPYPWITPMTVGPLSSFQLNPRRTLLHRSVGPISTEVSGLYDDYSLPLSTSMMYVTYSRYIIHMSLCLTGVIKHTQLLIHMSFIGNSINTCKH